jgi:hypothetical protein
VGFLGPAAIAYGEARWKGIGVLLSCGLAVLAAGAIVALAAIVVGPALLAISGIAYVVWFILRGRSIRTGLSDRARSAAVSNVIAAAWEEVERESNKNRRP